MGSYRSRRLRRRWQALQVPIWYYILLALIAVGGTALIVVSARTAGVRATGLTGERDYILGRPDAPVRIIEWGNFT